MTKIDITSLDTETKKKLDYYAKLAQELVEGITVDITIKLTEQPVFRWEEGDTGFVSPNSVDLQKQENAVENKYNLLIKEICDFSDNVADSLGVDEKEFFTQYFM